MLAVEIVEVRLLRSDVRLRVAFQNERARVLVLDVELAGVMSVACDKTGQMLMDMVGVRPDRDQRAGEIGRASSSSEPAIAR